jgi:hypothetical protein
MKKALFSAIIATALFACGTSGDKTSTSTANAASPSSYPANAVGYTLDNSENINTVKKAINAGVSSDSAVFMEIYADTAAIYDNMHKQTIFENMKMAKFFKSKGVTMSLDKINAIWETVGNKPDDIGITNYVNVYFDASLSSATKKVTTRINAVFAFKNGKIVREWDTYDSAPFMELLK